LCFPAATAQLVASLQSAILNLLPNIQGQRPISGRELIVMGMQCAVCAKKPAKGNQKTYRGKAKYLGGVGRKITGTSRRTFYPNLQCIQIVDKDGKVTRKRVCVKCIRSGQIQRPMKKKPFEAIRV
jgi:large subunit ribosomal protein L28